MIVKRHKDVRHKLKPFISYSTNAVFFIFEEIVLHLTPHKKKVQDLSLDNHQKVLMS